MHHDFQEVWGVGNRNIRTRIQHPPLNLYGGFQTTQICQVTHLRAYPSEPPLTVSRLCEPQIPIIVENPWTREEEEEEQGKMGGGRSRGGLTFAQQTEI
jgi:hypothetical protein